MEESTKTKNYRLTLSGQIMIAVSLLFLIISTINRDTQPNLLENNGSYIICYAVAVVYFIILVLSTDKLFRFRQINKEHYVYSLILFSISSFAINHQINLFSSFSIWVSIVIVLFYISLTGLLFLSKLPRFLQIINSFVFGFGLVLVFYFAIYLSSLIPIALIAFFFFGLSLHLIAPLIVFASALSLFLKQKRTEIINYSFLAGTAVPVLITGIFLIKWSSLQNRVHEINAEIRTRNTGDLPAWVLLCQEIPSDNFTQKIIKGKVGYDYFQNLMDSFGGNGFDETRKHDPLVNLGLSFMGDIDLDRNTRIKILKSQYNARHLAQRKLWSGKNLSTTEVISYVKIYPEYRLAYTEKTLTIKNHSKSTRSQQEAAYTFYLPEGSVATSLSLWVNGKEEKSRLTTKEKADSAYTTIVGRERRDPALLHWQEGNTLTVTVFPCTPMENRKFKIGITSPLYASDKELSYKNVYFEGPEGKRIRETLQIEFSHSSSKLTEKPGWLKQVDTNKYTFSGRYKSDWNLIFPKTTLSNNTFVFNHSEYSIKENKHEKLSFTPETVYLDLNKSWSKAEYDELIRHCKSQSLFTYSDKIIKITPLNKDEIYRELSENNFSIFPFYHVDNNSLVITKSSELSPNLSDLEGTEFLNKLTAGLCHNNTKVRVFQIGSVTSPFLKSLNEFQVINLKKGTLSEIKSILSDNFFPSDQLSNNEILLENAGTIISKANTDKDSSKAPDHLLRLFSYNSIMEQLGNQQLGGEIKNLDKLVGIANEGYVVSPVSSLVVLETQKDYDRFGIEKNSNSLKNATLQSAGAVPEPHEWALILMFASLAGYLLLKKYKHGTSLN